MMEKETSRCLIFKVHLKLWIKLFDKARKTKPETFRSSQPHLKAFIKLHQLKKALRCGRTLRIISKCFFFPSREAFVICFHYLIDVRPRCRTSVNLLLSGWFRLKAKEERLTGSVSVSLRASGSGRRVPWPAARPPTDVTGSCPRKARSTGPREALYAGLCIKTLNKHSSLYPRNKKRASMKAEQVFLKVWD